MANYTISITVTAANIKQVQKAALAAFGQDISHQVAKIEANPSRSERFGEAESLVEQAKNLVEELKGELEDWHGNLPESLQDADKGQEIQEAIDALDELYGEMDGLNFDVNFPKAY